MRKLTLALALGMLLHATGASATIATSALRGIVTSDGRPAAGVVVTANSAAILAPRVTTTDRRGRYWLALPPGSYEVSFSRAGLQTLIRKSVVELAKISRSDAKLEASEDEETVTVTAKGISVSDTTAITTHFTASDLDRLPVDRSIDAANNLSPGAPLTTAFAVLDDGLFFESHLLGREPLDEVTIIRGALPIEYERFRGRVAVARTHHGGEEFSLVLRDTLTDTSWTAGADHGSGVRHLFETASGGRIVPQRLWFFAAGWAGDQADRNLNDQRGYEIKLSSQLGAGHSASAQYIDAEADAGAIASGSSLALARYTGVLRHSLTIEAVASRSEAKPFTEIEGSSERDDGVTAKVSWFAASHLFSAGVQATDTDVSDSRTLYLNDRWADGRWAVNGGLRYEDGTGGEGISPRLAATYDLRGDGRQAFAASYGRYADARTRIGNADQAAFGFATAIGSSGAARFDLIRNDYDGFGVANSVEMDARYRMFDRFELGGNYTFTDWSADVAAFPDHVANVWVGLEVPVGGHELGVTLLERYQSESVAPRDEVLLSTDLALRYTIAIRRATLTIAGDALNAFNRDEAIFQQPRTFRFWARVRI